MIDTHPDKWEVYYASGALKNKGASRDIYAARDRIRQHITRKGHAILILTNPVTQEETQRIVYFWNDVRRMK